MKQSSKAVLGSCGEFYVAAFLAAQGFIVGIPPAGVPGCDLLATEPDTGTLIRIQVKTGSNPRSTYQKKPNFVWPTSTGVIKHDDPNLWYAFVALDGWPAGENHPTVFFVSSADVIRCVKDELNESRQFFWMFCEDSEKFRGVGGFRELLNQTRSILAQKQAAIQTGA